MPAEVMNRFRDLSEWAQQRLRRWAPEGWNQNTQFLVVFLAILGLHLWLAQVLMRSADTAEPGDGPPISELGASAPVTGSSEVSTGAEEEDEEMLRATPFDTEIPEFPLPTPTGPAKTLVLADSSPGSEETETETETVEIESLSPVALFEAEQGIEAPEEYVSSDQMVGPQLSDLIAAGSASQESPEDTVPTADSSSAPPVATPISTETEDDPSQTRPFRQLP